MADLTVASKEKILDLYNSGYSYRLIAREVSTSIRSVHRWIHRYLNGDPNGKRKNCGRFSALTMRQERTLLRTSRNEPFKTAVDLKRNLNLPVSVQTVRKTLIHAGLKGRIAAKKEKLTPQHKAQRLTFAQNHLETDWSGVVFSDEKCFDRGTCGQIRVRRPIKERYNPRYIKAVRRSGRFSLAVWACVTSEGVGPIHRIYGNLNANNYIAILQDVLLPFYSEKAPIKFVQDKSPVHTARVVGEWIRNHPEVEFVHDWPSKGADFNIIENVWAEMARLVDGTDCNNVVELWELVQRAWQTIAERGTYFKDLVSSMPRRLRKAVQVNGNWTGY